MRKLIADAVVADGIEILVKEVQLFSQEFDEKVEALATDDAKASEMEHAIRHEISVRVEENPVFYQSLRERLEEIIEQRRQERMDAAEQLKLLNDLREELQGEQSQAGGMELDARGFAIYGLLEKQRPRKVKDTTATYDAANRDLASADRREAVTPFTELVDWQQKDDVQREMRSRIKRQLRAGGIEDETVESLATDIVDLAKVPDRPMTGDLERSAITWGDTRLPYAIHRSARRKKTVAVTVDPSGEVLLVAPEHFSTGRLDAVVRRKAAWIVQWRRHVQSHDPPPAPREFVSGETVLYLGRHYLSPEGACERDWRGEVARRLAARARAGGSATDGARSGRPRLVAARSRGRAAAGAGGCVAAEGGRRDAARRHCRPAEAVGELRPQRYHPPQLGASSRPRCAWSTTLSSTSSCTCSTVVTAGARTGSTPLPARLSGVWATSTPRVCIMRYDCRGLIYTVRPLP